MNSDGIRQLIGNAYLPENLLFESSSNPTGNLHYIWDASVLSSLGTVQGTKNDGNQVNSWQCTRLTNSWPQGVGQILPFTQGTAGNCPLLRLNGVNGNSYLEFNGVNHRLSSLFNANYARDFSYSGGGEREIIVVCKFRSPPEQSGVIIGNYRNIGGAEYFYMLKTSSANVAPDNPSSLRIAVAINNTNNWPDNIINTPVNSFLSNQMTVCSYQLRSDSKLSPRVNGVPEVNSIAASTTSSLPNSSYLYLGATESGQIFANMDMYYMIMTAGNLTAQQREIITRYISHRFSITLGTTGQIL